MSSSELFITTSVCFYRCDLHPYLCPLQNYSAENRYTSHPREGYLSYKFITINKEKANIIQISIPFELLRISGRYNIFEKTFYSSRNSTPECNNLLRHACYKQGDIEKHASI